MPLPIETRFIQLGRGADVHFSIESFGLFVDLRDLVKLNASFLCILINDVDDSEMVRLALVEIDYPLAVRARRRPRASFGRL